MSNLYTLLIADHIENVAENGPFDEDPLNCLGIIFLNQDLKKPFAQPPVAVFSILDNDHPHIAHSIENVVDNLLLSHKIEKSFLTIFLDCPSYLNYIYPALQKKYTCVVLSQPTETTNSLENFTELHVPEVDVPLTDNSITFPEN